MAIISHDVFCTNLEATAPLFRSLLKILINYTRKDH